jgi:hypothetical protein
VGGAATQIEVPDFPFGSEKTAPVSVPMTITRSGDKGQLSPHILAVCLFFFGFSPRWR